MQNELKNLWGNRSMESLANEITTGVYQFRQEYKGMGGKMTPRYNNAVEWTEKNGISMISMGGGMPDRGLLPFHDLMEFANVAWKGDGQHAMLEYGRSELLREELAKYMTRTRGRKAEPDEFFITSGNGGGLNATFRAYLQHGDVGVVESPLWSPAAQLMKAAGADVKSCGMDESGISVVELEQIILETEKAGQKVKIVYLQPLYNNPTGTSITEERAMGLLKLCAKYKVLICADEAYEPYAYNTTPVYLSTLSGGYGVITHHTFSKTLGTGLRLGWVFSRPELLAPLGQGPSMVGSVFLEYAVGELMKSGRWDQLIKEARESYAKKVNVFCDALETSAGKYLTTTKAPTGGFFVWLELKDLNAEDVVLHMMCRGVNALLGENLYGPGHEHGTGLVKQPKKVGGHVRIAFIGASDEELVTAARIIGESCQAVERGEPVPSEVSSNGGKVAVASKL